MKVSKVPLTVLKVVLKSGVGKTSNKPYSFYAASIVDDDANVFQATLEEKFGNSLAGKFEKIRNETVKADLEIKPKGFDAGITIIGW